MPYPEQTQNPGAAHIVHEGLREHGLVNLVVAVLAVADEVDDDIAAPALPPLRRQLAHLQAPWRAHALVLGVWITCYDLL